MCTIKQKRGGENPSSRNGRGGTRYGRVFARREIGVVSFWLGVSAWEGLVPSEENQRYTATSLRLV